MDSPRPLFVPRIGIDWKPWSSALRALPLLAFALSLGFNAVHESDLASVSQKTSGTVLSCSSIRYGAACIYEFSANDRKYTGKDSIGWLVLGSTVDVFYDPRDPNTNSLVDYAKKSRNDWKFSIITGLASAACVALLLWNKWPSKTIKS